MALPVGVTVGLGQVWGWGAAPLCGLGAVGERSCGLSAAGANTKAAELNICAAGAVGRERHHRNYRQVTWRG